MNPLLPVAMLALICLIALTAVRQFLLEPLATPTVNAVWFALQILPLVIVAPGVWRLRPTSLTLASLAAMLYFVHGVLVAATPQLRTFGLLECVAALTLVVAAALLFKAVGKVGEGAREGAGKETG